MRKFYTYYHCCIDLTLLMMVMNYGDLLFFAFIIVGKFTNNMDHREDKRKLEPKYAATFGPA